MKLKALGLVTGMGLSLVAIGCTPATTTTNTNANHTVVANSSTAVLVNNNTPVATTNGNVSTTVNHANNNITREEYERDKAKYADEAKAAGRSIGTDVNDGWLWTKSRATLLGTDDLRESTINVDVDKGVVKLTGTVANAAQKDKAAVVVKALDGVKSVDNQLKVAPNDSLTNMNGNANTTSNANTVKH